MQVVLHEFESFNIVCAEFESCKEMTIQIQKDNLTTMHDRDINETNNQGYIQYRSWIHETNDTVLETIYNEYIDEKNESIN